MKYLLKNDKNIYMSNLHCHTTVSDGYYGYAPQAYDEMLRCKNNIYCLSTDDNHNSPDNPLKDSFGECVMINSDSLSYNDIMNSLQRGDFYSTQAPEIYEISLNGNTLNVKCSEVRLIVVYTDGRRCYMKEGESLTSTEFKLTGNEAYIRVMCRDKQHKDANSNAYWINMSYPKV